MIKIDALEKKFDKTLALKGISFEVRPGEILGLLGPNGAGKSTTVKILTGLLPASGGRAWLNNYDISSDPIAVKKSFGYVPESGALYESLTGWEYLELVADLHHLDRQVFEQRAGEFLDLFELHEAKDKRISGYSKGMRQKILISAALIHNPPVLLFDEPLNGVDANTALIFKQLLKRLGEQGKTILFCSHVLEVVERLCTRIVIIRDGQVVADGTPEAISKQTGHSSLENAFHQITGGANAEEKAEEFLQALEGLKA